MGMDLQEICEGVVKETEAVLCCVVFDLDTDLTLASAHRPGSALREADVEAALRTGKELFRGKFVDQFVQSLATGLISTRGFVREVQITTADGYQFMAAIPGWEDGVLALFTENTLTLGLGWMAVHQTQELLAETRTGVAEERRGLADADRAPLPPTPEATSEEVVDPKPVPPPSEETAPDPIPNPLARRRRNAETSESAKSPSGSDGPEEAGKPVKPASRAKSRPWARNKP